MFSDWAVEISLLAFGITFANLLAIVWMKRRYDQALHVVQSELNANLNASYGLARHVRHLRQANASTRASNAESTARDEQEHLSEVENDIITFLRPKQRSV